ncbi:MAG: putative RNase H-like HicB family nuclease [Halobacteriales archaeon]
MANLPNSYISHRSYYTIMASSTRNGDPHDGEIRLWREDEVWIAKDVERSVTTQGPTREEALENLDEAIALHDGEIGRAPTDEELQELGIDPADNTTGDEELPDVLE